MFKIEAVFKKVKLNESKDGQKSIPRHGYKFGFLIKLTGALTFVRKSYGNLYAK